MNIAGNTAVVEPVKVQTGDTILDAFIVGTDQQRIFSFPDRIGQLHLKGRKAAFVLGEQCTVEVNRRTVVDRPKADKQTLLAWPIIKVSLVPGRPFVIGQLRPLRVEIPGHM